MKRRSRRNWTWTKIGALALVFWLIVGLADVSWYAFSLAVNGSAVPWRKILQGNIPFWIVAAILTLPVVWVARKATFERGHRLRDASILAGTFLLFSLLHRAAYPAIEFPWRKAGVTGFVAAIPKMTGAYLDFELLLFLVIIGAVYVGSYYVRYRERTRAAAALELERARLEASLNEARLAALKMQIQPHFLFNVLHAISTLVLRGEARAADQMIAQLSQFLRMTLDGPFSPMVPLEVEIDFLDAYLRIQKVRFEDRLRIKMDIDERARGAAVPHLLLQPLVENCIEHGLEADAGSVDIEVRARVSADALEIQIADNGPGVGPREGRVAHKEGTGLRNVRARLDHLYPDAHGFELATGPSGGACATIRIPFRAAERTIQAATELAS